MANRVEVITYSAYFNSDAVTCKHLRSHCTGIPRAGQHRETCVSRKSCAHNFINSGIPIKTLMRTAAQHTWATTFGLPVSRGPMSVSSFQLC